MSELILANAQSRTVLVLEDKILWPWPQSILALASRWPGLALLGLGLVLKACFATKYYIILLIFCPSVF